MSHSIQIIDVKGFYALTSQVILEHDCVTIEEKGPYDLSIELSWGLPSNLERDLKNNNDYFNDRDLYVLISEDERTYRGFKLSKASHSAIQWGFRLNLTIQVPGNHDKEVIDYLVRKRENRILESYMEKQVDKILGRE